MKIDSFSNFLPKVDRPIYGCFSVFSLSLNLLFFESIHFVTVFISCWAWYSLERKKEGKKIKWHENFLIELFQSTHTPTHTPYNCNYFYHDCPLSSVLRLNNSCCSYLSTNSSYHVLSASPTLDLCKSRNFRFRYCALFTLPTIHESGEERVVARHSAIRHEFILLQSLRNHGRLYTMKKKIFARRARSITSPISAIRLWAHFFAINSFWTLFGIFFVRLVSPMNDVQAHHS